ncbi:MAG: transporter substrate-binding protein [Pseudomonadota bacterium]
MASEPDVILNTLNGDSNTAFFSRLRAAGVSPDHIPTVSFSIGENELRYLDAELSEGDYASWNYFQSLDTFNNREFVAAIQARFGENRTASDPMESAYIGVHLWARAANRAGTIDTSAVLGALPSQTFAAPHGPVAIDGNTFHTWKSVHIGRIRRNGQFDVVWQSETPVQPSPFPLSRSRESWEALLENHFQSWGENWSGDDS